MVATYLFSQQNHSVEMNNLKKKTDQYHWLPFIID